MHASIESAIKSRSTFEVPLRSAAIGSHNMEANSDLQQVHESHTVRQLRAMGDIANSGARGQSAQHWQAMANRAMPENSGLPNRLRVGIESLSGFRMDDVMVHYNSPKPAEVQAHAFAQEADIHLAPGQEHHLPHEAWHVVQQKQGRVSATEAIGGHPVNSDAALEYEADAMGAQAAQFSEESTHASALSAVAADAGSDAPIQRTPVYIPGAPGPHSGTADTGTVAIGPRNFTDAQRDRIFHTTATTGTIPVAGGGAAPTYANDGTAGGHVVRPVHSRRLEAQIDHIVPENKGGGNTNQNAQILDGISNAAKRNTYPSGYSGYEGGARVYIEGGHAALAGGAVTLAASKAGGDHVTLPGDFTCAAGTVAPAIVRLAQITGGAGSTTSVPITTGTPTTIGGAAVAAGTTLPAGTAIGVGEIIPAGSVIPAGSAFAAPGVIPTGSDLALATAQAWGLAPAGYPVPH